MCGFQNTLNLFLVEYLKLCEPQLSSLSMNLSLDFD